MRLKKVNKHLKHIFYVSAGVLPVFRDKIQNIKIEKILFYPHCSDVTPSMQILLLSLFLYSKEDISFRNNTNEFINNSDKQYFQSLLYYVRNFFYLF